MALLPHGMEMRYKPSNGLRRGDWLVDTISLEQASTLIRTLHYAGGSSNTATFRHGLFRKEEWPLVPLGAAVWIPPTRSAAEATHSDWRRVLALSRLVLDPDVPTNGASFLLARSVRLIAESGDWDCLVTYADEWQGHTGAIYRAAGWEYVGLTKPERTYVRHGVMLSRKAGPNTRTHAQMLALGAECIGSYAKHKFVKRLRATPPPPDPCLVSLQGSELRNPSEKEWREARNCPKGCGEVCADSFQERNPE